MNVVTLSHTQCTLRIATIGSEYVSPLLQSSSNNNSNSTSSLRRSLTRERLQPQPQHAPQWFTAAPLLSQFYASSSPLSLSSITTSSSQYHSHSYQTHSPHPQQHESHESHRYAVESHRLYQHHPSHHHHRPQPPPPQRQAPLRRLSLYDLRASTSSSNDSALSPVEPTTTTTSASNASATTALSTAAPDRDAPAPKRKKTALRLRNFLCMHPGCGKAFTDNAHLRDHTFVHTGERSVHCSTCGKAFGRLSTLHDHERVHTRAQPYACSHDGCDKRYSSRSALRFHVSRHADVSSATTAATEQQRPCPSASVTATSTAIHTDSRSSDAVVSVTADHSDVVVSSLHATIATQQTQIAALQAELARLQRSNHTKSKAKARAGVAPRRRATPTTLALPMVAPVRFLLDGVKPFECHVCHHRVANYFQLAFHAKQHPTHALDDVVRAQAPLPVGPKFCPEVGCVYAEASGAPLKNLQTLKRHWQRRHTLARPYACTRCATATGAPVKTFKTRENLRAHEKECRGTRDSRDDSGEGDGAESEQDRGEQRAGD